MGSHLKKAGPVPVRSWVSIIELCYASRSSRVLIVFCSRFGEGSGKVMTLWLKFFEYENAQLVSLVISKKNSLDSGEKI